MTGTYARTAPRHGTAVAIPPPAWSATAAAVQPATQRAMYPPSTYTSEPVTKMASSLASHATAAAISSGLPSRPIGVAAVIACSKGVPFAWARIGELLSASVQAEAADPTYSHRIETLSWALVPLFAPARGKARGKGPEQVHALALVQELDRLAYFIEVRAWEVEREVAVGVIADHWYAYLRQRSG